MKDYRFYLEGTNGKGAMLRAQSYGLARGDAEGKTNIFCNFDGTTTLCDTTDARFQAFASPGCRQREAQC
jgi:hypothetical protein